MNLNVHPAPGLGILQAGWFSVPQDPFRPTTYTPRIGEILANTAFSVPQNPLKNAMTGSQQLLGRVPGAPGVVNGRSANCGCGGSCGGCGGGHAHGMGDISSDFSALTTKLSAGDYTGAIQSPILGIPAWALVAGLVGGAMLLDGMSSGATYGRRLRRNPMRRGKRRVARVQSRSRRRR